MGENAGNFTMGSTATVTSQASYNIGVGDNTSIIDCCLTTFGGIKHDKMNFARNTGAGVFYIMLK